MIYSRIMADELEIVSAERVEADPWIATDESAGTEPEIEPDESSEEEPEKESDESTVWEGEYGEAGCPVWMGDFDDVRCGRKLYVAPDGVDKNPVCLMHSKDPGKQSGPLFDHFWPEFEKILECAGANKAHFERFVFPQLDLRGREIQAICLFSYATLTENADFSGATFTQCADFRIATFRRGADFNGATFTGNAEFCRVTFMQNVDFSQVSFAQNADFGQATFVQDADFFLATFTQDADFRKATFTQAACFEGTKFHGTANWKRSRFLDQAEFRHTKFDPQTAGQPSAVFALAYFSRSGEFVFDDVDLSRALFHNSDMSQVWFTSSVRWGKREDNRGIAVFDEKILLEQVPADFEAMIPLEEDITEELQRNKQRDYRAVAQIYQQLKKNYDSRLDYWTANEFHFGEMEMKRLAGPTDGPFLWLRQWLHRSLSFVALYRYASDYGNSYGKPALWLLAILLLFAALFPLPGVGLKRQGAQRKRRPTPRMASAGQLDDRISGQRYVWRARARSLQSIRLHFRERRIRSRLSAGGGFWRSSRRC